MSKYNHKEEFYKKQYIKYKAELGSHKGYDYNSFKSAYKAYENDGSTNIRKNLVYEAKYEVSYNTYVAEKKAMKELGIKIKFKELLNMTTQEFAEKYADNIMAYYNTFKTDNRQEVSDFISMYFFGSL